MVRGDRNSDRVAGHRGPLAHYCLSLKITSAAAVILLHKCLFFRWHLRTHNFTMASLGHKVHKAGIQVAFLLYLGGSSDFTKW